MTRPHVEALAKQIGERLVGSEPGHKLDI